MNRTSWLALVVAVGAISGCASNADIVDVPLNATPQNAGHTARASLNPTGDTTSIYLTTAGLPDHMAVPSRLETEIYAGSCQNLGKAPAYKTDKVEPLNYLSLAPRTRYGSQAPVALADLTRGDYALLVRTSAADGSRPMFCGDIKAG